MEYNILGYNISIDDKLINGLKMKKLFEKMADKHSQTYKEKLSSTCTNMEEFAESAEQVTIDSIQSVVDEIVDMMTNIGVYTVSSKSFLKELYEDELINDINDKLNETYETYYNMLDEAMGEIEARENRKNNRTRMRGNRYTGLINGGVEAGAYNLASGAAHSIANSIGNASTKSKLEKSGNSLRINSINELSQLFYDFVMNSMIPMIRILIQEGIDDIRLISDEDASRAKALLNNINNGNVPEEDVEEKLVECLVTDPSNEETYQYIIMNFSDENGELQRLARDLSIISVDIILNQLVKEAVFNADFSSVDKINEEKMLLEHLASSYDLDLSSYIKAYDRIILLHNKANSTCDGHTYDSEDELENAKAEVKKFCELTLNVDANNEEKLLELKSIFEGFTSQSKDKYVDYINNEIAKYDKRRRTVNGTTYKTREEADCAIESISYINDLLSRIYQKEETLENAQNKIKEYKYSNRETERLSNYLQEAISARDAFGRKINEVNTGNRLEQTKALLEAISSANVLKKCNCMTEAEENMLKQERDRLCTVKYKRYDSVYESNKAYWDILKKANKYNKDVVNKKTDGGLFSKLASGTKEYFSKGYEDDYKYFIDNNNGVLPPFNESDIDAFKKFHDGIAERNKRFDTEFKSNYGSLGKEYYMDKSILNGESIIEPKAEVKQEHINRILDELLDGEYSKEFNSRKKEKQASEHQDVKSSNTSKDTLIDASGISIEEKLRIVLVNEFGDDEAFVNRVIEEAGNDNTYKILIEEVPNHGYSNENVLELIEIFK